MGLVPMFQSKLHKSDVPYFKCIVKLKYRIITTTCSPRLNCSEHRFGYAVEIYTREINWAELYVREGESLSMNILQTHDLTILQIH